MDNSFSYSPSLRPPRHSRRGIVTAVAVIVLVVGFIVALNAAGDLLGRTIWFGRGAGDGTASIGDKSIVKISDDPEYAMPGKNSDRIDILILGMRGRDDPDGGLLTDTAMLLSYDRNTQKASLVSVPRDLYLRITDTQRDKINTAYERLGLAGAKKLFSRALGVSIDYAVVFDFSSFQKIVDTVGGIDIVLDKPFEEPTQWGYAFSLPAGANHLTGEQALYYVRSRYSSSDFDRARRQQQVMFAIKDKILADGLLGDPIQSFNIIQTIRKNIETDINILNLNTLVDLAHDLQGATKIRRYQLTSDNLLYESRINDAFVLLPRGDTLKPVKTFFAHVTDDTAPLLTPPPTPQPSATPEPHP